MTRFADPERCPDCANAIVPRAARCEECGLPLHGPLAQRLFQTLTAADSLLVELRASALPAAAPVSTAHSTADTVTPSYVAAGTPAFPTPPPPRVSASRARTGLSAASVPQILLGLGALCVLVAAIVFLAVTWSLMGVGGRTATLVAFTAASAALAWWLARRGLRAGAESLALVSLGLLTLDVIGADNAGWLGSPSAEMFLVELGATLVAGGLALALATRPAVTGALTGAQVVLGLGVLVAAVGLSDLDQGASDADLFVTVVLALAASLVLHRAGLVAAALTSTVAAGLAWLVLLVVGINRVLEHASFTGLWAGANAWPALGAAAVVGAAIAVRTLSVHLRVAAAGTATLIVTGVVVAPGLVDATVTAATLTVLAVVVVTAAAAWVAPRPWGLTAAPTQVVALAWVGSIGVALTGAGSVLLGEVATTRGTLLDRVPALASTAPAPWLLPLCVLAAVACLVTMVRAAGGRDRAHLSAGAGGQVSAALLAASTILTVGMLAPPVWVPVTLLLLAGAGFTSWWAVRRSAVALAVAATFGTLAIAVSLHAVVLTVIALAVVLVVAGLVHLREREAWIAQLTGVVVTLTVAGLTWSVGDLIGAAPALTALVGLLLLAALGALSPLLPGAWWATPEARLGLEVGAAAVAVPLGLLGVMLAPATTQASWAAGYLTLAGVAVTGTALARADRRLAGWPGGLLLAAATWVRLDDLGVREPEAYTLPSAVALLAVGLWQLHRRDDAATLGLLSPGLTLALVPSLVWALAEPSGLRALLLGLVCLGLVGAGLGLRWTAPVLAGAVVGALLVLRLAAPYLGDAVPRWVLIGGAGALLIAVGVTWEQRVNEARRLRHYVAALR